MNRQRSEEAWQVAAVAEAEAQVARQRAQEMEAEVGSRERCVVLACLSLVGAGDTDVERAEGDRWTAELLQHVWKWRLPVTLERLRE